MPSMPKENAKHMKKFALLLSFVFVTGVAVAEEAKKPEAAKTPEQAAAAKVEAKAETAKPMAEKGKTHMVTAEVVSVDSVKNTITIKGETENKTAPVDAKAAHALKTVKAVEAGTVQVATITQAGLDHVQHRSVIDGIARPSPDGS